MGDIKVSRTPLLAAVLFFLFCSYLQAQYDNGSLVGTIRDKSGAAIPNAVVTITNNATAIATKFTSNGEGDYEVPSLHVGVYNISASAPGFSDAGANNITISVGGRQHIDLSLNVGATQTTVEVSDVALHEGNTPSPQDGNNIRADYAQSGALTRQRQRLALQPANFQHHKHRLRTSLRTRAAIRRLLKCPRQHPYRSVAR
jgi:hypothetical protein